MSAASSCRLSALLAVLLLSGCDSKSPPPKTSPSAAVRQKPKPKATSKTPAESPKTVAADPVAEIEPEKDPEPPPAFRPPDRRPVHDDAELAAAGIHRYESKRLRLYTDIEPEIAKTLPPVVDQLYEALVKYFGPLPPDEHGAEFQMTGYLIRDEVVFREQGLMEGLPVLHHGKHVANRFWMREQQFDYFRRHLLLHECTHCFMTFEPGPAPPVWYMEGMAELFGTHRVDSDGRAEFCIMPTISDNTDGWGRIAAVRRECAEGRPLSVGGVYNLPEDAFFKPIAYAWSWALCKFFDSHPRYAERFRELGRHLHDGEFEPRFRDAFYPDRRNLSTEWTLFENQLQPGYDTQAAAIEFQPEKPLEAGAERKVLIQADRGWQDIGLRVSEGQAFEISAAGRFTLADDPKPWVSEPQGISFEYFGGLPLGRLVACFDADPADDDDANPGRHLLQTVSIGKSGRLTIPANGRLLLRLNDAWDLLSDNTGGVDVTIRRER